ncbi:nuclease-related domain-containing protein [Actinosynnema sp. CA-248983]
MIPDSVHAGASRAEQEIFSQLAALEVAGWEYAMHSTNLPEHDRKRVCEIDFLLLGERGLLVLEAKGGEILLKKDVWHTRDLKGKRHRLKESPLDQARTSMFALAKVLRRTTADPGLVDRTVFGYGAVFPDSEFDAVSVEWTPEMVINSVRLASEGWADCLDRLGAFWESKPGSWGPCRPTTSNATSTSSARTSTGCCPCAVSTTWWRKTSSPSPRASTRRLTSTAGIRDWCSRAVPGRARPCWRSRCADVPEVPVNASC